MLSYSGGPCFTYKGETRSCKKRNPKFCYHHHFSLTPHKGHGFDCGVGKISWRRAWQPTPVLLPAESHGQRPGRLQSAGSHRVRRDWSDWASVLLYPATRCSPVTAQTLPCFKILSNLVRDFISSLASSTVPSHHIIPPPGKRAVHYPPLAIAPLDLRSASNHHTISLHTFSSSNIPHKEVATPWFQLFRTKPLQAFFGSSLPLTSHKNLSPKSVASIFNIHMFSITINTTYLQAPGSFTWIMYIASRFVFLL